jgi:hypothetical protein
MITRVNRRGGACSDYGWRKNVNAACRTHNPLPARLAIKSVAGWLSPGSPETVSTRTLPTIQSICWQVLEQTRGRPVSAGKRVQACGRSGRDGAACRSCPSVCLAILPWVDTSLTSTTSTLKLLQLPTGFNFSNPDLNFTRKETGGTTSFSDSELDKITGYNFLYCTSKRGGPLQVLGMSEEDPRPWEKRVQACKPPTFVTVVSEWIITRVPAIGVGGTGVGGNLFKSSEDYYEVGMFSKPRGSEMC